MNLFKTRLKTLRKETKKTQQELAEFLSISKQTISNYESGIRDPSIDVLIEISSHFDVTVDYLIGKSDYKNDIQKSLSGILAEIIRVPSELISDRMNLFDRYFDIIKIAIHPYLSTGADLEEITEDLEDCMKSLLDCSIHSLNESYYGHEVKKAIEKGNFESMPEYPDMNKQQDVINFNVNWKYFIDNLQKRYEKTLEGQVQKDGLEP